MSKRATTCTAIKDELTRRRAKKLGRRAFTLVGWATIALILMHILFDNRLVTPKARSELLSVYSDVNPGDEQEDIEAYWSAYRPQWLTLYPVSENLWIITTPSVLGASNWILRVEFEKGQVSALRIRTEDNDLIHPQSAPVDKEKPSMTPG